MLGGDPCGLAVGVGDGRVCWSISILEGCLQASPWNVDGSVAVDMDSGMWG